MGVQYNTIIKKLSTKCMKLAFIIHKLISVTESCVLVFKSEKNYIICMYVRCKIFLEYEVINIVMGAYICRAMTGIYDVIIHYQQDPYIVQYLPTVTNCCIISAIY